MSRRSQYECECECECEGEGEGEGDYDYDCGTRRDIDGDSISSWGSGGVSGVDSLSDGEIDQLSEDETRDLQMFPEAGFRDGVEAQSGIAITCAVEEDEYERQELEEESRQIRESGRVRPFKASRAAAARMVDPYADVHKIREVGKTVRGGLATVSGGRSTSYFRNDGKGGTSRVGRGGLKSKRGAVNRTPVLKAERKKPSGFNAMMSAFDRSLDAYIRTDKFWGSLKSLS